jgi:hypothetical protein
MKASEFDRSEVLEHAKRAALWSTTGEEGAEHEGVEYENLDDVFTTADVTGEAEEKLVALIDQFFEKAGDLLDDYTMDAGQIGHDIILTTNGHGAGFWDRGLGKLGDKLTKICEELPEYQLYVGDDGKLYA